MGTIMEVYYGSDALPYKDSARTIHYPIVGNDFVGASNVSAIRFYVDQIGGTESTTWVANTKLPNGKKIFGVISDVGLDSELNEHYVELTLSGAYTALQGYIYISLNGYSGGVDISYDEDTEIYTIIGTPTIQATGVIKLNINYAVSINPNAEIEPNTLQAILQALAKAGNVKYYTSLASATSDLPNLEVGQLIYYKDSGTYTPRLVNSAKNGFDTINYKVGVVDTTTIVNGEKYIDLSGTNIEIYSDNNIVFNANGKVYYGQASADNEIATVGQVNTKQDTLVSGTNIKTINNLSLLGSGNIDIQSGGADYDAGYGIDITGDTISVDTDTIATKDFVNSSISTETATFRGTYNIVSDLGLTTSATEQEIASAIATKLASLSIVADNNDYVFIAYPDATVSTQFIKYDRYKYDGTNWSFEYTLNNSSFTAEQWAAINSGITSGILSGLATKTELSDYVDLSSAQTISGVKTFSNGIKFGANTKIEQSGNDIVLDAYGSGGTVFSKSKIVPNYDNQRDLGTSIYRWKDLYLSGSLKDGTNSISVADISNGTFNVINASDIVNNTLTQEQYDLITNGKPTLILGSPTRMLLVGAFTSNEQNFIGISITNNALTAGSVMTVQPYVISVSNKTITYSSNRIQINQAANIIALPDQISIKGKAIPAYPSNTGTFTLKYVDGVLTWVEDI